MVAPKLFVNLEAIKLLLRQASTTLLGSQTTEFHMYEYLLFCVALVSAFLSFANLARHTLRR